MRKRRVFAGLLLTGVVLVAAAAVRAQGTAAAIVTVTDARTGSPVARATVTMKGVRSSWVTDSAGTAAIRGVAPGSYSVTVDAPGYAKEVLPVPFEGSAPLNVAVSLTPAPLPLRPIEVEAQRRNSYLGLVGFYDRERMGGATFISGPQLEKLAESSHQLVDVMRRVDGFVVVPTRSGVGFAVLSSRGSVSITRACYPEVYLDGMRMGNNLNDILPLEMVSAVEAYAGVHFAPMEYGRNPCGTILIWSKHGGH